MPAITAAFPSVVREGEVDRALLAQEVAGAPEKLKLLESIVHPMVVNAELNFLREQEKQGAKLAVLEIPLLFETDARSRVDVTVVVSAPEEVDSLLKRQLSDAEKRSRADFVVDTGTSLADMQDQIDKILDSLWGRKGRVMERLRHRHAT